MEEKRYSIEKINKISLQINESKKAAIKNAINSAGYSAFLIWFTSKAMPLEFNSSDLFTLLIGGAVGTVALTELINGKNKVAELIELNKIKNKLLEDNQNNPSFDNSNEQDINGRSL